MKYLGVDWGYKKVGLAISEGELSSPRGSMSINNFQDGLDKLSKIYHDEKFDVIIIGMPEGRMGEAVNKVNHALIDLGIAVVKSDETLTTHQSKSLMIEQGYQQKSRRDDNSYAAALILQRWLDDQKT